MDPRSYVRPGDPISLAAEQINGLNRMLQRGGGFGDADGAELPVPYLWCYGRNLTSATIPRWAVTSISGMLVAPTADDAEPATQQFLRQPILQFWEYSANQPAVVAVEPIPSEGIGRVAVSGVVQVRSADAGKLAGVNLYEGNGWSLVALGSSEIRLGTIAVPWLKGTTATVTQRNGAGTAIPGNPTFSATNHFATVSFLSGTRNVACALIGGTWCLIAAECA